MYRVTVLYQHYDPHPNQFSIEWVASKVAVHNGVLYLYNEDGAIVHGANAARWLSFDVQPTGYGEHTQTQDSATQSAQPTEVTPSPSPPLESP